MSVSPFGAVLVFVAGILITGLSYLMTFMHWPASSLIRAAGIVITLFGVLLMLTALAKKK